MTNKPAAAVLPPTYLLSGRRASIVNEVREYAKLVKERRGFLNQPALPVRIQRWEGGKNEGKGAEAGRKGSVFILSRLGHISQENQQKNNVF